MSNRRLFCEISPLTYRISEIKCCVLRIVKDIFSRNKFASQKTENKLQYLIYSHNSLIRRRLGNCDLHLQENKAVNLSLAAPKINGIIIHPGETFSFWKLVGSCTKRKGYKEGLVIKKNQTASGTGGGMCQFSNLIHWMVLHTPLEIVEHHHHDRFDLFPDFNRAVPFGTGSSIGYNYIDYRFKNNTDQSFQLITYTSDEHLHGELRSEKPLKVKYHIAVEDEFFSKEDDVVYRNGKIIRKAIEKATGNMLSKELIKTNHARVMYDTESLEVITV